MLRWQTAGESHGEALVAMIEGLPAGVRISTDDIVSALARRRLGYGRGARMKFEQDKVRLLTGVRHGLTLGSPVAIEIANTEWPKWTEVMSADALDHDLPREGRNAPLSRPRPGHADLTGMRKYGFDDARPVLERSSARETASRVALGEVAKQFLDRAQVAATGNKIAGLQRRCARVMVRLCPAMAQAAGHTHDCVVRLRGSWAAQAYPSARSELLKHEVGQELDALFAQAQGKIAGGRRGAHV